MVKIEKKKKNICKIFYNVLMLPLILTVCIALAAYFC